jgi:cytochrome b6-f complex iron-sulfur subunit
MENKRREFLMKAGSVALFAAMGISLSSCGESSEDTSPSGSNGGNSNGGGTNSGTNGVTVNGSTVRVDTSVQDNAGLKNAGSWSLFVAAGVIVVNIDGDTYRAFTNVCPHSACDRNWTYNNSNQRLTCTCHGSIFSATNGNRISGPANRNLDEFSVSVSGDIITITK